MRCLARRQLIPAARTVRPTVSGRPWFALHPSRWAHWATSVKVQILVAYPKVRRDGWMTSLSHGRPSTSNAAGGVGRARDCMVKLAMPSRSNARSASRTH
jgi:hypothetical protein